MLRRPVAGVAEEFWGGGGGGLPAASTAGMATLSVTVRSTFFAASLTLSTGVFLYAAEMWKGAAARGALAMATRGRLVAMGRSIFSVRKDMV